MGIKRVFGPTDTGGGGTGDLTLTTGGFAARADLNAQNLTASASGGTAGYTYAWSCIRPNGSASTAEFTPNASAQNPTFTPARVGLYAITCTVTDSTSGSALTASSTQAKNVGTLLGPAITGLANSAGLTGQVLGVNVTGGTGSPTYAWACTRPDNTTSTSEFSSTTSATPTFTPASVGLHAVRVTVTDSSSTAVTTESTAKTGTGSSAGSLVQIDDLTGWTKWAGESTDNAWLGTGWNQFGTATPGTGAANIVLNAGVFTFSDADEPSGALNQPGECFGYVSPASYLSSIDTTKPGTWNLFLEVTSDQTNADARAMIGVGFVSRAYDGADYDSTNNQGFAGFVYIANNGVNKDKSWNFSGYANGSLQAGGDGNYGVNARVAFSAFASGEGTPQYLQSQLYDGTTPTTNESRVATSNTTAPIQRFATDNDVRLVIYMGRLATGPGGASSISCKLYWSYTTGGV
jgi:hypothetical protein